MCYLSNLKEPYFFTFLFTIGPALPKGLLGNVLIEVQGDVFLFGGLDHDDVNFAIYQFSCSSAICSWSTLNQALKVGRIYTVAIPVPDSFCLDVTTTTTPTPITTTTEKCNQGWIGNDYCDDINNNVDCNFDGGDCYDGGTTIFCNQDWIGDEYCDDINNNIACNFDGGDCCGNNVNTDFCTDCLCLEQ